MSDQAPVRRRGRKAETDEARAARIAGRVKKFKDTYKPTQEYDKRGKHLGGTMPLNGGFFKLERMKASAQAKARGEKRTKARGDR